MPFAVRHWFLSSFANPEHFLRHIFLPSKFRVYLYYTCIYNTPSVNHQLLLRERDVSYSANILFCVCTNTRLWLYCRRRYSKKIPTACISRRNIVNKFTGFADSPGQNTRQRISRNSSLSFVPFISIIYVFIYLFIYLCQVFATASVLCFEHILLKAKVVHVARDDVENEGARFNARHAPMCRCTAKTTKIIYSSVL